MKEKMRKSSENKVGHKGKHGLFKQFAVLAASSSI